MEFKYELPEKLVQTYLFVEDKKGYFVSTIYRQSSVAIEIPPWFYETMVWEWNPETRKRGFLIAQYDNGGYKDSALMKHFTIVENLLKEK